MITRWWWCCSDYYFILCDLGLVTRSFWASVISSVKREQDCSSHYFEEWQKGQRLGVWKASKTVHVEGKSRITKHNIQIPRNLFQRCCETACSKEQDVWMSRDIVRAGDIRGGWTWPVPTPGEIASSACSWEEGTEGSPLNSEACALLPTDATVV